MAKKKGLLLQITEQFEEIRQRTQQAQQEVVEGAVSTLVKTLRGIERDADLTNRKKDRHIAAEVGEAIPVLTYLNRYDVIQALRLVWDESCQNAGLDLDTLIEESQGLDHTGNEPLLIAGPTVAPVEREVIDVEATVRGNADQPVDGVKYIKIGDIYTFFVADPDRKHAAKQAFRHAYLNSDLTKYQEGVRKRARLPLEQARELILLLQEKHSSKDYFKKRRPKEIDRFLQKSAATLDEKVSKKTPSHKPPPPKKSPAGRTIPMSHFYGFFVSEHEEMPLHFEYATMTPFLGRRFDLLPRSDGKPGKAISRKDALAAYQEVREQYGHEPWIKRLSPAQLETKIEKYFGDPAQPTSKPKKKAAKKTPLKIPKAEPTPANDPQIVTVFAMVNHLGTLGYNQRESFEMIQTAENSGVLGKTIKTDPLDPAGYDQTKVKDFYLTIKSKK